MTNAPTTPTTVTQNQPAQTKKDPFLVPVRVDMMEMESLAKVNLIICEARINVLKLYVHKVYILKLETPRKEVLP